MSLELLRKGLKKFRKEFAFVSALLLCGSASFAQCGSTLPAGATLLTGNDNIILCLDNGGVVLTNVVAGKYIVVNVVKGINYDFRITNAGFSGQDNLSVFKEIVENAMNRIND